MHLVEQPVPTNQKVGGARMNMFGFMDVPSSAQKMIGTIRTFCT